MPALIEYYLAPQSPFVYLGHARFSQLVARSGAAVRLKPCDFGKVFAASGGLPLGQRAAQRQAYRLLELKRWSEFLQIPMNVQPRFFPVSGDPAARLILAAEDAHGSVGAMALLGAIGRALWAEERDIADTTTLAAIADAQGLNGAALIGASQTAEIQARYEAETQGAIAAQVFGAPTYILDGEMFWGQDRLDFLERALTRG